MEQIDYQNSLGWRHQYPGTRLQWEHLLDQAEPGWKDLLTKGGEEWRSNIDSILSRICTIANLDTEGLLKERTHVHNSKSRNKRKRSSLETIDWHERHCIMDDLRPPFDKSEWKQSARAIEVVTDNETLANIING